MKECQQLHNTAVRDIVSFCEDGTISDVLDVIKTGSDTVNKWLSPGSANYSGSIVKRSSDLVLVFPVLVSTSLKMSTAVLISKAIERKCTSLLQILFSAVNLTNYNDTRDLYDYIKKFHNNIKLDNGALSLDDFIRVMDSMTNESAITVINKDAYDAVMESMRNINVAANTLLRETSVNDYVVNHTMFGNTSVTLEKANAQTIHNRIERDGGNIVGWYSPDGLATAVRQVSADEANKAADRAVKNQMSKINASNQRMADNAAFFKSQVITSDIAKANELTPTLVMINFQSIVNGTIVNRTGVIGVKAKMYPVESMQLVERLSEKYSDSNTLFSFVKASTKEKSFFKDFVFAIDKAKIDAINIAKGSVNAKMFRVLERRARKNKFHRLINKNDASAITTLVLTQDEVEYLKKYSNMDLEKASVCRVLMEGFNLMGVVLVDNSIEVARFLYDDGEGMFETLTFDTIAKEDKNQDYKKIISLIDRLK